MTREEARQILLTIREGRWDEQNCNSVLDWLEHAGLIKFDKPRDALMAGLAFSIAEASYTHDGTIHYRQSVLTPAGARQVVERIEQLGFKITK